MKKNNRRAGIYLLTAPNGKKYVGQSIDLDRRICQYADGLGHARVGSAINRFGFKNFKVCYLHILPTNLSYTELKKRLNVLEYASIKKYKTLYPAGLNCVMPCAKPFSFWNWLFDLCKNLIFG